MTAGALLRDEKGEPIWRYDVRPFQQAVKDSGLSGAELEARCGWQGGYAGRVLGLRPYTTGHSYRGRRIRAKSLSYENAKKIAKALDLDLVEWEI